MLREYAERKLLSRRRWAVEALRNLDDEEGLDEARKRALERLPASVRDLVALLGEEDDSQPSAERVAQTVRAWMLSRQGWRWILSASWPRRCRWPLCAACSPRLASIKSTFGDTSRAFSSGRCCAAIAPPSACWPTPSSAGPHHHGDDGHRQVGLRRRATANEPLPSENPALPASPVLALPPRCLAHYRPAEYPYAAAEALIHWAPQDARKQQDLYGPYASCYLLHRIAFGAGKRFVLDNWRLEFRYASARAMHIVPRCARRCTPNCGTPNGAYLRVLGAAKLPEAHVFAVRALEYAAAARGRAAIGRP